MHLKDTKVRPVDVKGSTDQSKHNRQQGCTTSDRWTVTTAKAKEANNNPQKWQNLNKDKVLIR